MSTTTPKGEVLVEMSEYIPPTYLPKLFIMAAEIGDAKLRSKTFEGLIPRIKCMPNKELYSLMCTLLRRLSKRSPKDLLSDLQILMPMFDSLGRQDVTREIIQELKAFGEKSGQH